MMDIRLVVGVCAVEAEFFEEGVEGVGEGVEFLSGLVGKGGGGGEGVPRDLACVSESLLAGGEVVHTYFSCE
jgi:hypothetical protein